MNSAEFNSLIWAMKRPLQLFGCWPYSTNRLHSLLVFLLLLMSVMACTAEIRLLLMGDDMNMLIEACLVTSAFYMTVARFITFSYHREDMRYVIDTMRRDWMNISDDEDAKLLSSKTKFAFKLSKLFTLNVLFAALAFTVMPGLEQLLSHGGEHKAGILPFGGYYYFNHTRSSPVYWATYTINAIVGAIGCSTIAGATSFSLISTMHAAAKFALVRQRFNSITNDEWMQQLPAKFNGCVREHQQCIKFAEVVEDVINFLALAQFVISTGLVCFAGFQLTTMLQDRGRLTKYGSFLNAAIFELFIFSYSGQCLKSESEAVADFAYSSNWLGAYRKSVDIQMVIMRARKACTITAAKFYDMCLESFLKVLSSSFSYFSVLIATQDNN